MSDTRAGDMSRPNERTELTVPRWASVLRALREVRAVSQHGWASHLQVGRTTVQRWERGEAIPDAHTETLLLEYCRANGLFRRFEHGSLEGVAVTPAWLSALLEEARLAESGRDLPGRAAVASAASVGTHPVPLAAPARLIERRGERPGRIIPLGTHSVTIGRDVAATIVIENGLVSMRHVRIDWDGSHHMLSDLTSRNGTYVNGDRLTCPHRLEAGDEIVLAAADVVCFVFSITERTLPLPPDRA